MSRGKPADQRFTSRRQTYFDPSLIGGRRGPARELTLDKPVDQTNRAMVAEVKALREFAN